MVFPEFGDMSLQRKDFQIDQNNNLSWCPGKTLVLWG
jgi:hypothetical protein